MAVGNRMPARITQSHLSRLLAGVRALSWTVYPGDLAKLLDEAVRLVRCDADVRSALGHRARLWEPPRNTLTRAHTAGRYVSGSGLASVREAGAIGPVDRLV